MFLFKAKWGWAIVLLWAMFITAKAQAQQWYVATNGNDANTGTFDKPFATLNKAKETVKQWKQQHPFPQTGLEVIIRGGNYTLSNSFELTKNDGGTNNSTVTYKNFPNEVPHFVGSTAINPKCWKPLNAEALKRLHPGLDASKLVALDVKEAKLKNVYQFAPANQFTTNWYIIDLFANNKRQPIAQWPNPKQNIRGKNDAGWVTCNGSKANDAFYFGGNGKPEDKDTVNELDMDGSNRSTRWANAVNNNHEIWLKGLWRTAWEPITMKVKTIDIQDNSIAFEEQPPQGMGSKYSAVANEKPLWRTGSGKENWFAINLLEEIDQPGEWALDVKDHKIYYYPPAPIAQMRIQIADMKQPVIVLNGVENIAIQGVVIEGGLGNGIEMNNCNNVLVAGCTIKNVGNTGLVMTGGSNNQIQSNDIYDVAAAGIELKNLGSREKLQSCAVTVSNNHIHHVGKLAFKEAINLTNCVGVTVANNLLHDIPKGAIITYSINNCIIEYNEIHNIALKEGDTGVFYSYGGWSTYGNIFRYNFSHHTNRANGLYSDDGTSGNCYYFNIVQGCIDGVKFGGGHDNIAENNLFVESKSQGVDDRGINRNYRLGTKYETNLTKFNVLQEPWLSYGLQLQQQHHFTTNLWGDVLNPAWHPEYPNGCRMKNNVAVASGGFRKPKTGAVEIVENIEMKNLKEAVFYNYEQMDLRTNNASILQKFPNLNEVFVKIGLLTDSYRATIPSRLQTGGFGNRSSAEGVDAEDKMTDVVPPTIQKMPNK